MTSLLLVLAQGGAAWTIGQWVIAAIVIGGLIAALFVVLRWLKIEIPTVIFHLIWIGIVVAVGVAVAKFIMRQ